MSLAEQYVRSGNWLFRRRGYLPVFLILIFIVSLYDYRLPPGGEPVEQLWELLCLAVSLFGLGIRIYTVGYAARGTSGRNTDRQVAAVLNKTGIYSVVRHPLYLGNFFMWLGVSMFLMQWWISVIVVLIFWVYYERIMFAEEAFLRGKFGDEFTSWASETPAFIPDLRKWIPPVGRFSLFTVLKREQSGLLAVLASFMFLEVAGDYKLTGRIYLEPLWMALFSSGFAVFLILTWLKKSKLI